MNNLINQWWRVAGGLGILFVGVIVVALIVIGNPPDLADDDDAIRSWFVDNGTRFLVGDYLLAIALTLLFLPFVAGLYRFLAAAETGTAFGSRVALVGGIATFGILAIASTFWATLAAGLAEDAGDDTIRAMMYLDAIVFGRVGFAIAVMVVGAGVSILLTGVLWRWLAYYGFALAIVAVIGALYPIDDVTDTSSIFWILGWVVFLGWGIWTLAAGAGMIMFKGTPGGVAPETTATS
jgi:hypothetical protein